MESELTKVKGLDLCLFAALVRSPQDEFLNLAVRWKEEGWGCWEACGGGGCVYGARWG